MNFPITSKAGKMQTATEGIRLNENDKIGLYGYLLRHGLLQENEKISLFAKAGQGNMNLVLRVTTAQRSLIIKQARPWVEKYPHIAAPEKRICMEAEYYRITAASEALSAYHPRVLHFDAGSFILALEDLGPAADFTTLYQKEKKLSEEQAEKLAAYLSVLHQGFRVENLKKPLLNHRMRILNAEHIFEFPLAQNNGFNLDAVQNGLASAAAAFRRDADVARKAKALMDIYFDDGKYLLHGDFYPGSWLDAASGIKIIDPEFCFCGPAEFDAGVFLAHLLLARQPQKLIARTLRHYRQTENFSPALALNFAGIEIIRRIIGLAQLPLDHALDERLALLQHGRQLLLEPQKSNLWNCFDEA